MNEEMMRELKLLYKYKVLPVFLTEDKSIIDDAISSYGHFQYHKLKQEIEEDCMFEEESFTYRGKNRVRNKYLLLFNLDDRASQNDIKEAYRKEAKRIHPDVSNYDSTRDMQILAEAYDYLKGA